MMMDRTHLGLTVFAIAWLASPALAQNHAPNPYRVADESFGDLPDGRKYGASSAVYPDRNGNIWVAERCGANLCVESKADPVLLFDPSGKLLKSFGAGMIAWPHGIFVDREGNVWITEALGYAPRPAGWG